MNDNLSPADIKAVVGDNNNGGYAYPYPVFPYGNNNNGFGSGDGSWLWFILILAMMNGGWGFGGGFGGFGGFGMGMDFMYPWLANGQQEIMQNTNNGFDTLQLSNQLGNINSGVQGLSTQICSCCADISQSLCNGFAGVNATVNSGFANAETAANARQMANMQQAFASQTAITGGLNDISTQLCQASGDNRLATCQTQNTIISESAATRFADANNTRDIITNATDNTRAILDKLCQLELDGVKAQVEAKNDKIADLQRELSMADLRASQTAQNAFISQGFANEVDQLYNRLNSCPVPTTPVYRKNSDIYLQRK